MRLPGAEACVVERAKVIDYLLSVTHPTGRHKGAFFRGYGFSPDAWEAFADALRQQGAQGEVVAVEKGPFGTKYVVDGGLSTPAAGLVPVRTVWFAGAPAGGPRLVTAYPVPDRGERR